MPDETLSALRASFTLALGEAYRAGRGVPPSLEQHVRDYARALRLNGVLVEKMIVDVKGIVRAETGHHELVFVGPIVGWAVAGYFAGTSPKDAKGER